METLLDTQFTRIRFIDHGTDILYVCFGSLLGEPINEHTEEYLTTDFYSLSKGHSYLLISDKQMSWGNKVEWNLVTEVTESILRGKQTIGVGLSMGGMNVVLASQFMRLDKVIAFNPQYTIDPRIFPETEYWKQSKQIKDWKFRTIDTGLLGGSDYYIFIGEHDVADTKFTVRFVNRCNVFSFGKSYGHNIPKQLKDEGRLQEFFDLFVNNDLNKLSDFVSLNYQ